MLSEEKLLLQHANQAMSNSKGTDHWLSFAACMLDAVRSLPAPDSPVVVHHLVRGAFDSSTYVEGTVLNWKGFVVATSDSSVLASSKKSNENVMLSIKVSSVRHLSTLG